MVKKSSIPETVSGEELAILLNVDIRTVRNHAAAGTITKIDRNHYPLAESIRGIIAAAKKSSKSSMLEREQAAIMAGKRKLMEMRIAQEEGHLIELSEATDVLDEIIGTFRAGLNALPARITRDVELRKTIRAEAEAMLHAASEKFTALAGNTTTNPATKETDDDER